MFRTSQLLNKISDNLCNRLVAGSTKEQSPKVQFKLNKNNTFVRGEIEKCDKVISHGRTYVCTDKAITTRFTTEKAKGSRSNVTNAIYQTDESTEIDGGGDMTLE